jgi:prepilin-type N-terminal cleavage/methylation domain-containing protein
MRRDNLGFSLLELIVTVAIIALMVTLLVTSIVPKLHAEEQACANKIDAAISQARLYSMSRENNNATSTLPNELADPPDPGPARVTFTVEGKKVVADFYDGKSVDPSREVMGVWRGAANDADFKYTIGFIRATGAPIKNDVTTFPTVDDTDDSDYIITVNGWNVTIDAVTGYHEVKK